jgi:membrane-associated phospholipid phosphatase
LAALPLYVGAARLKSQAHWQTDVLAGAALGAGIGYFESTRNSAWSATVLPRGVTVGLSKRF